MAPAVLVAPRGPDHRNEASVIEISVARSAQEAPPSLVECFRHEGEDCPRCDGPGFRPHRRCEGCGEPSGRPSQGGKVLLGLKNRRGLDQPMYCLSCHPELAGTPEDLTMLEKLGG
jgi:hypothetical protein